VKCRSFDSPALTAIIEREDDGFVSLCPELDIASQGATIEEARANLVEALTLFFATASQSEVVRRFRSEVFVTQVEVPVGSVRVLSGIEVCKILEQQGFIAVRQHGSHRIMQLKAEGTTITVPVPLHDTLRRGTLQSIVRQAGLPRSLFETE